MRHVATHGNATQQAAFGAAFSGRLSSDEQFADAWLALLPLYFSRFDESIGARLRSGIAFSLGGFQHFMERCFNAFDWGAALGGLRIPCLVIAGADDWLEASDSVSGRTIATAAPSASFVSIPDCGHYPFVEHPSVFCRTVGEWLDQKGHPKPGCATIPPSTGSPGI
jgi:pimeloyl-ACP methyl ester carboxylesterase